MQRLFRLTSFQKYEFDLARPNPTHASGRIAVWRLDLDDVGPEVREVLSSSRRSDHCREFEDAHAVEWPVLGLRIHFSSGGRFGSRTARLKVHTS